MASKELEQKSGCRTETEAAMASNRSWLPSSSFRGGADRGAGASGSNCAVGGGIQNLWILLQPQPNPAPSSAPSAPIDEWYIAITAEQQI
jgi:hypothetical protein